MRALADAPDAGAYLALLLAALVELTEADSGSYWSHNPADTTCQRLCSVGEGPDQALFGSLEDACAAPTRQIRRSALTIHEAPGRLSHLPLVAQGQIVGSFLLHNVRWSRLPALRARTVDALVQQATPLLRLTAHAEQEQQDAVLEERLLLASEIHDTLAQYFVGVLLQLSVAQNIAPQQPDEAWRLIARATDTARMAAHEARQSIWALQPPTAEYRDLAKTLIRMIAQQTRGTGVQAEVRFYGAPYLLPTNIGMNLLRIAQEALHNTLHHAQATRVLVDLTYAPDHVRLCLQDDGRGFDRNDDRLATGFGLSGMQQRAARIGGALTIDSHPGQGVEVIVTVDAAPDPPPETPE